MRPSRKVKREIVPTFAFVVDGETEIWYLEMLKRNERQLRLNIKPEIPHKKSIADQFHLVKELSGSEYSKVFWIVDLDTIIHESKDTAKGKKTALQAFSEYRTSLARRYKNVIVIVNNPCLEFWFLLHFEQTSRIFNTCATVEAELKKKLDGYEKTKRFFTKQDDDIYLKLKPYLKDAINNSESLGSFDVDDQTKATCEMFVLFKSGELA
jgi:RloB-like protein